METVPSREPSAHIVSSGIEVISVNLGRSREIYLGRDPVETGILKCPSSEPVVATSVGLQGDFKSRKDATGHQALCAYSLENYEYWSPHFGQCLAPGTFGENLTLKGATEEAVHLGGRFTGRDVVLEVTYPRTPCKKLNVHLGRRFSGSFLQSAKVGYYLRVLRPGSIGPGDILEYRAPCSSPTIHDFVNDAVVEYWDAGRLRELSELPSLSSAWRDRIQAKVSRAESARGWIGLRSLVITEMHSEFGWVTVTLRCRRGRPLPELAHGDTLSFEHRGRLLESTCPIVSMPFVGGVPSAAPRRAEVDAYCLRYEKLPNEVVVGSAVRARAPSSLLHQ